MVFSNTKSIWKLLEASTLWLTCSSPLLCRKAMFPLLPLAVHIAEDLQGFRPVLGSKQAEPLDSHPPYEECSVISLLLYRSGKQGSLRAAVSCPRPVMVSGIPEVNWHFLTVKCIQWLRVTCLKFAPDRAPIAALLHEKVLQGGSSASLKLTCPLCLYLSFL